MTIGEFVKARRETLGLTQEQIAEKVGVRAATISRYESGEIDVYGLAGSRLQQLCDALKIQPNTMMNILKNAGDDTMDDFELMDMCRMYKEASKETQRIIKMILSDDATKQQGSKKGTA